MGQHFVFAVPDSVVEPTVASDISNVSCTLQRLTSDPDIYIVPLDGCGVNKQVRHTSVVGAKQSDAFHKAYKSHLLSLAVDWK